MTDNEPDLQPEEVRRLARQVAGWACIRCGTAPAPDRRMKPAGTVDGRQVFWCADDCIPASGYAERGDVVEAWLKTKRDQYDETTPRHYALDNVLDDYRLHADTHTPLTSQTPEGMSYAHGVGRPSVKAVSAPADEIVIPVEVAAHVLFHFGQGGWPTSGFRTTFILAIAQADITNRNRLALGFPEYVAAFNLAQLTDDGVAKLQAIVARDDE